MSLAIVLLLDCGAIVFTDSRSLTSDFSKSETGVKKTAILTHNGGYAVVAFTGDGEINGKLTRDILVESAARNPKPEILTDSIVKSLKAEFATDVANYAWENSADKEKYLHEARVVLHILTAPKEHCIWEVSPLDSRNHPFPDGANESFSGVKSLEGFADGYRHWDLNLVCSLVPKSIDNVCASEPTCGYPVDVTVWKLGGVPKTVRCMDLKALNAHLAALAL